MANWTRRLFSLAASLSLLWLAGAAAGCYKKEAAMAGNPVDVWLTLDPATNKVIAEPLSVHLHYQISHDFARWGIKQGTTGFNFDIEFKPPSKLPKPTCSGDGMGRNCRSIIVTEEYKGTHQYSIVVHATGGDVITDPEVTIEP